jgi:Leucine-rich repeat (LRR) protein
VLKQLVYLDLESTPIKRLHASLTNLVNIEILDLMYNNIKKLPYDFHMLAYLKFLDIGGCKDLQYLPCCISKLTSLQYLCMDGCEILWKKPVGNRQKKVFSFMI